MTGENGDDRGATDDRPAGDRGPTADDDEPRSDDESAAEDGVRPRGWPVPLRGVTESIVTTLGPNGLWNAAALGLFAGDPVTARTWGNTRTRRNFHRQGEGYVQFSSDPVDFVDAALSIAEHEEPVLESADAWVRVRAEQMGSGTDGETRWEEWALEPVESAVERKSVPTINRGFGAVIEATVAASRLGVAGYRDEDLRERLEYCAAVVDRTGGPRDREALSRVKRHSRWEPSAAGENEWL